MGTALVFLVGGLAVAELPPFGTFVGKTLIEDAATARGGHWVPWLFVIAASLTGGAILRATGRIFLGLGPDEPSRTPADRAGEDETSKETRASRTRTPRSMFIPAAALVAAGLAVGLVPGLSGRVERAAASFEDRPGYSALVLRGERRVPRPVPAEPPGVLGVWYGLASTAGALCVAGIALFRRRAVPDAVRDRAAPAVERTIRAIRALQSGHVGDYVAWFTVGLAALGGLFALAVR